MSELFFRNDFCSFSSNPQMKKAGLLIFLLACFMSSCYFVDDIFDPDEPEEESLQQKTQNNVKSYLGNIANQAYQPLGFSPITIVKPIELIELEELQAKADKRTVPSAQDDSLIAVKKRFIEENRIHLTIQLDHFFTLKDTLGETTIYESTFFLDDTLKVVNLSNKIKLKISADYVSILDMFFYEQPIFISSSYQESKILSQNFYGFFKNELEQKNDLRSKSEFLMHVLKITREVKIKGAFEQQEVMEKQSKEYLKNDRQDIQAYQSVLFSPLYETINNADTTVLGYYFFHKFIGNYNEKLDTNVVLIEFSKFYEIEKIYQMDRPFDQYFEN